MASPHGLHEGPAPGVQNPREDILESGTIAPAYRSDEPECLTEGTLRVAPLLGLPGLLAAHGLNADTVIREAGCDPACLHDPENTISFSATGHLLVHVEAITGCPHIGLELCRSMGPEVLGPVGQAMRHAPDVGTALRYMIQHLHLHDRGAVPFLRENGSHSMLGYTIFYPLIPGTEHIYDGALTIVHNVLTEFLGPGWRATKVCLFRHQPRNITPYRQHFCTRLHFAAEHAAVVFPSCQLHHPLPEADPDTYHRAQCEIDSLEALGGGSVAPRVRRLLRQLLATGCAPEDLRLERIAERFALHPRTLNRRLRAQGTAFNALLEQTRYEIARQLLRDTRLQTAEIAVNLGYADSAVFSHAFRRWSGVAATTWRSLHCPG